MLLTSSPYGFSHLSLVTIASMTKEQINALRSAQIKAMTFDQVNALSGSQLALFSFLQIQYLTNAQVSHISVNAINRTSIANLQWICDRLTEFQVAAMSQLQFRLFDLNKLAYLNVSALSNDQLTYQTKGGKNLLEALSSSQFASLSVDVLSGLNNVQVSKLAPNCLNALTAEKLNVLHVDLVNQNQLLIKDQDGHSLFGKLTAGQINSIDQAVITKIPASVVAELTAEKLSHLSQDMIQALHVEGLSASQLEIATSSTDTLIHELTKAQIGKIDPNAISSLTPEVLAGLDNLQLSGLTGQQVSQLNDQQLQGLNTQQIQTLDASGLSQHQLHVLDSGNSLTLLDLTNSQISDLSATTVGSLINDDINSLTEVQLQQLNGSGLTYEQLLTHLVGDKSFLQILTTTQISELSSNVITALSKQDISTLTVDQIGHLTANLVAVLNSEQIASMNTDQVHALNAIGLSFDQLFYQDTTGTQILDELNPGQLLALGSFSSITHVLKSIEGKIDASTGVTQDQLDHLKTYATEIETIDGENSYESYIVNALVNGNRFNQTWTGGGELDLHIGNLTVGSSEYVFDHLVDKWIDGADNPQQAFCGVIYASNMPKYTHTDAPLFNNGTPQASDVCQGAVGDCYLLSALADVAYNNPDYIKSMIWSNGNGTYGVRFYDVDNQKPIYVTVDDELNQYAAGWGNYWSWQVTGDGAAWVSLIEKAYVEYAVIMNKHAYIDVPAQNSYSSIYGGWSNGLSAITGLGVKNYSAQSYSTVDQWDAEVNTTITVAVNNHTNVMYDSHVDTYDANGKHNLIANHIYSVLGVDSANGNLILRNPWGNRGALIANETFEASPDTLWGNGKAGAFIVSNGYLNDVHPATNTMILAA
jgi:hypothetical protein